MIEIHVKKDSDFEILAKNSEYSSAFTHVVAISGYNYSTGDDTFKALVEKYAGKEIYNEGINQHVYVSKGKIILDASYTTLLFCGCTPKVGKYSATVPYTSLGRILVLAKRGIIKLDDSFIQHFNHGTNIEDFYGGYRKVKWRKEPKWSFANNIGGGDITNYADVLPFIDGKRETINEDLTVLTLEVIDVPATKSPYVMFASTYEKKVSLYTYGQWANYFKGFSIGEEIKILTTKKAYQAGEISSFIYIPKEYNVSWLKEDAKYIINKTNLRKIPVEVFFQIKREYEMVKYLQGGVDNES